MTLARVFAAAAGCVVLGASAASCSGSFGSGTGLPNAAASPSFGGPSSAPTPPTQSSVILTYGESTAFQSLTEVAGYGGAIAFPKAPEPTAAPQKGKPGKNATPEPAPTPVAVAIGATLSIVKPQDGPDINFVSGRGKKKRSRELPARALVYITLLPTHDATLESYPRFALDVPREIASQYRDGEFGLALWNSGEKDAKYRLAVAELDTASTPPPVKAVAAVTNAPANPSPGSSAAAIKTMSPLATATPATRVSGAQGASPSPAAGATGAAGGPPSPSAAPTLPPAHILFAGTAATLKLVANRPAVFALYALPHPSATPVPKASVVPAAASSHAPASASASPASSATASPTPAGNKPQR
jgi:hypothetical protein